MRITKILITVIVFMLSTSCEQNDKELDLTAQNGFGLVINDSIVYYSDEIEFYDFSSHLIYLKDWVNFFSSNYGTFAVFVDNIEIYSGQLHPLYSSYMPMGPVINCAPSVFGNYIIPIGFNQFIDSVGNSIEDPRNDSRIIENLKKQNKYKEGLSCEILTVKKIASNNIEIDIKLTNNGPENLLYLDPDKMGLGLFHYFTNGLLLRNLSKKTFTHQLSVISPEPWDTWDNHWLSVINGNEDKFITITYDNFDILTVGEFEAIFNFPGLSYQVEKEDLQQCNGRIWLGTLHINKNIQIQ